MIKYLIYSKLKLRVLWLKSFLTPRDYEYKEIAKALSLINGPTVIRRKYY